MTGAIIRPCRNPKLHNTVTCPSCKAWRAWLEDCRQYATARDVNPKGRAAHLRFDQDVTAITGSGIETTIERGEHHPGFLAIGNLERRAVRLAGARLGDGTAWWAVAAEWLDCLVEHIPVAYFPLDTDVAVLGEWSDEDDRRFAFPTSRS